MHLKLKKGCKVKLRPGVLMNHMVVESSSLTFEDTYIVEETFEYPTPFCYIATFFFKYSELVIIDEP